MKSDAGISPDAPEGFKSASAKQMLTAGAIAAAAIMIVVQVILPILYMIPTMALSMRRVSAVTSTPGVHRAVSWHDRVWLPEDAIGPMVSGKSALLSVDPATAGSVERRSVDLSNPSLLVDGDQLWLVAGDGVARFANNQLETFHPLVSLPAISRPFLLDGRPAVIAPAGKKHVVWSLADGEWQERGAVNLDLPSKQSFQWNAVDHLDVVTVGGTMHVFLSQMGAVYSHQGLPWENKNAEANGADAADLAEAEPAAATEAPAAANNTARPASSSAWERVGVSSFQWSVIADGDRVALYHQISRGPTLTVVGLVRAAPSRWAEIASIPSSFTVRAGVCSLNEPGAIALISQGVFGGLTVATYKNNSQTAVNTYHGVPSPGAAIPDMSTLVIVPQVIRWSSLALFVVAMCGLMSACRDPYFRWPAGIRRYAPLWRRGAAVLVDSTITSLPGLAAVPWFWRNFRMERLTDPNFAGLIGVAIVVAVLWWVVTLFALSFCEGRWGWTPGKLLLRIRVLNTDLKPCGFGRAVIRRVLLIVDAMFSFAVGLLLIALTSKQQRLGDLAASTIVLVDEP